MNLENDNFVIKNIRQLKSNIDSVIQEPDKILKKKNTFYSKSYSKCNVIDIQKSNLNCLVEKMPKHSETEKDKLEEKITLAELNFVILTSKNDKGPGPDGCTDEFYKQFWPEIGNFLLDLMIFYKEQGELNDPQKAGVITCIPKGDKICNQLKNWRPMTLLNSVYKFFSAISTKIIKTVLDKIILHDQRGFLNRFIGENTRLISHIIRECQIQNVDGLIIIIDFEKAFDSI